MGAGALAPCSCVGWSSLATERVLPKRSSKDEELYPVFKVDFAPTTSFSSDLADSHNPLLSDQVILFSWAAGHSGQPLHHLPLVLLKRLLLEYRRRRSEFLRPGSFTSKMTIVVAAAISCPPIDMHITSSMRVQVIFDTSKQYVEGDSALSLTLFLCSRCGVGGECTCGWRKQHVILPEMERQSVLQFIASTLPRIPAQALPCYRLRVDEAGKRIATTFCVQVYKHEVQRLIVEYPYAVFKMKLSFGNLRWRIARRFSEFVELHTRLKILVEESMLPRLPPTAWLSATEPSFLFQRRLMLENYLKGMFMVGALQDSVPLLVFLGVLSTTYFELRSYRSQILHLQVLEFYTRPGDLILFNGRAKVSVLQRSITRSEWDHVAIVVPPSEGEYLQLLEATGDGVTLTPLTARLLAYSAFHVRYFVLRKLRTPLLSRAVVNDLLERFTAEVEGLCYGLSFRKILYTGQVEQRSQNSTYFCSELIAEAYKSLGIISSSSEANNFWPGSFSPGDFVDTELARHGASLSPEIIIDCKLLEVATATRD